MTPINLTELIANLPLGTGLSIDPRDGNVSAMTGLMSQGACPTSAINVLHYYPDRVGDILDATRDLSPALRERNQAILAAICKRLNGRQRVIYDAWQSREALRRCTESDQLVTSPSSQATVDA